MQYDRESLYELVSNIDLLEYASRSFDFKKRGHDTYATNCPLHTDITPSLFITPSKNVFHCLSCGVGGSVLQWMTKIEGMSFRDALQKVSDMTGTDLGSLQKCDAVIFYKSIKQNVQSAIEQSQNNVREILPANTMDKFIDDIPEEWVEEGIRPDIMKKYGIRIDKRGNRIVYPVYDSDGNLIGVKGRTRFKNYKEMNIQKYMNYTKIGKVDYFVGMKENEPEIRRQNRVVIFEGIKSGMKVEGWGEKAWLASETSWLNDEQVKLLLRLRIKEVVIAFDQDVCLKKIRDCTSLLRRFTNVYAVIDKNKLLDEKMSPCDKGRDIWKQLYDERIRL